MTSCVPSSSSTPRFVSLICSYYLSGTFKSIEYITGTAYGTTIPKILLRGVNDPVHVSLPVFNINNDLRPEVLSGVPHFVPHQHSSNNEIRSQLPCD